MRARAALASVILAATVGLPACGGSSVPRAPPLWERPGLYGAIRPEMGPPQPGDLAPAFELPSSGGLFRLASLRGGWVVLHFTASWCPYCDAEVEHLGELARVYGPAHVRVVLVGVEEEASHWNEYVADHVPPSITGLDDVNGAVARTYAPPHAQSSFVDRAQVVLDSTVILDPEGKIRLFLFPDTKHFDPTFRAVRSELDRMLADGVKTDLPPPILPPERVVTIESRAPSQIVAGDSGEIQVVLSIAPGYHVMSDWPSDPSYIPTRVGFGESAGVTWGDPRYPPPEPFRLEQGSIATFQGRSIVRVPFAVSAGTAPSRRTVEGTVRYQACTEGSCLFPVTRRITVALDVVGNK